MIAERGRQVDRGRRCKIEKTMLDERFGVVSRTTSKCMMNVELSGPGIAMHDREEKNTQCTRTRVRSSVMTSMLRSWKSEA